jgi:hypothetical protein
MAEPAGRPRLATARRLDGEVAGLHDRAARLGRGGEQGVVLGRAQRPEPARREIGRRPDAEVSAVHMRMRAGAGLVQRIELGRHMRRMLVPVGHLDSPEDDIPAAAGVAELAPQPAGRHDGVGVGGGQPDRGRVAARRQSEQFGHACRPGRADVAGADAGHPDSAGLRGDGRLIRTGIGDHEDLHGDAHGVDGPPQCHQAGGQQPFLIVRRHDDTCRLDGGRSPHTSPVAWATETGVPSVRTYTSARKSGSACRTSRASPGWATSTRWASSPDRG